MNIRANTIKQSQKVQAFEKKDWTEPQLRKLSISETNGVGGNTSADGNAPFGGAMKPSGT